MSDLSTLTQQALDEVAASTTLAALGEVRVRWLGKKGLLTEQLKSLGALPSVERPAAGALINVAKEKVQAAAAVADKTPYESYVTSRIGLSIALSQDDGAGAAQHADNIFQLNITVVFFSKS